MEQAALTGPVADVVAAFEHGKILVKKIEEKRAQKGVPLPPALLEQSLVRGPRAIREAYETGRETFGDAFNIENDRATLDAFKDILVNLQSTFFQHLFTAQEDDTMLDFGVVINATTMGRVRGVHVLNEMYMRMAEAPQDWTGQQNIRPQPSFGSQQSQNSQQTSPSQDSSFNSPVSGFVWNGHSQNKTAAINSRPYDSMEATLTGSVSADSQFYPSHSGRVASSPTNHSRTSSDTTNLTILSEDVDVAKFPAPPTKKDFRDIFSHPNPHVNPLQEGFQGQNLGLQRLNSASSDGQSLHGSSSGASLLSGTSPEIGPHLQMSSPATRANRRVVNKIPLHESPPAEYRKRLNNKPKSKPTASQDSHSSPRTGLTASRTRKFSILGGPKALKEDFAGFCEGAYLMQTGQDGMKIRNQSISMTGQNNYWLCSNSKCCFEGHAVPKKDAHKKTSFGFDEDILELHGVRYRWSFFAKSHTAISNSKAGYEYQCVFCIGRGLSPFRVKGNRKFIEHVATHQGQTPNPYKMPRFNYVVGRSASPWENFDINLPAATAMELETMEAPAELEALEPTLPEMEAPLGTPATSTYLRQATDGHEKLTNGSGLGIRLGTESASGAFGGHNRDLIVDPYSVDSRRHPPDSARTTETVKSADPRNSRDHHHRNGTHHAPASPTNEAEQESPSDDEPLDQSWSHVRDSIQNLQPAPLFARKGVSQKQAQKPILDQNHHPATFSQFDEIDDLEINPYDPSIVHNGSEHTLRGGRILVHHSNRNPVAARPVVESRQASLVMPEPEPHQILTPEMWHPGTKWMD